MATTFLVVVASTAIFATALSALRMYSRDAFRQRAFALRDELFLYAADGNVPFDHPAYWRLRLMMNATIRFTHRMTFGELILPMCVLGVTKYESIEDSPYQRWQEALSECHPDVRKALVDYQRRFSELIAVYVLAANPFSPYLPRHCLRTRPRENRSATSVASDPPALRLPR